VESPQPSVYTVSMRSIEELCEDVFTRNTVTVNGQVKVLLDYSKKFLSTELNGVFSNKMC
jgi:hypothetical protein